MTLNTSANFDLLDKEMKSSQNDAQIFKKSQL